MVPAAKPAAGYADGRNSAHLL